MCPAKGIRLSMLVLPASCDRRRMFPHCRLKAGFPVTACNFNLVAPGGAVVKHAYCGSLPAGRRGAPGRNPAPPLDAPFFFF